MYEYLEAFFTILLFLTFPIPVLVIIRLIKGWNEIHYVKDLFRNDYYLIDTWNKLGSVAFVPIVSHVILFNEIIGFILKCIVCVLGLFLLSCEKIGNIRLK